MAGSGRGSMAAYWVTVFVAAFLLFQVEPMMGKFILPWFGGAQAVWTTCVLFFQLLLLAGYAYAHAIETCLAPRMQAAAHICLVTICVATMAALALMWGSPIMPPASWKPVNPDLPLLRVLLLLFAGIGLPYFTLSATAPLLQAWFAKSYPDSSPYRLYALSNVGAMLGLLTYPFLVEPALRLHSQAQLWCVLYIAFALSIAQCARALPTSEKENAIVGESDIRKSGAPGPAAAVYALWIILAACPSLMFLAVTNQLCQDVAPVPFLWVVPLAIYLPSFIFCFGDERWYRRGIFNPALAVAIVISCALLYRPESGIFRQIAIYLSLLAISCMVCHGELVRLKPRNGRLTRFYLMVSLGGALGGLFGAVAAPLLFRGYWELHLSIFGCAAALYAALVHDRQSWIKQRQPLLALALLAGTVLAPELILPGAGNTGSLVHYNVLVVSAVAVGASVVLRGSGPLRTVRADRLLAISTVAGLLVIGAILLSNVKARLATSLVADRNFYGAYAVVTRDAANPLWRSYTLRHGYTAHGMQFPQPDKRYRPTTYYGPGSGIGLLLVHDPPRLAGPLRIGIIGLGAGTIAAYGRPQDYIRFYEIDPAIIKVAVEDNGYFTYVRDSRARVDIIPGDARISMEREVTSGRSQRFDILAIDAFSSDSIPVHLLTREAFAVYLEQLASDGVLAFHISNRYLNLRPVLLQAARYFRLESGWVHDEPADTRVAIASDWVLLARNTKVLGQPAISARLAPLGTSKDVRLWTDDYSNLFQVLR